MDSSSRRRLPAVRWYKSKSCADAAPASANVVSSRSNSTVSVAARRTMERSAALTAALPPRSDTCRSIKSRSRRAHTLRPSTPANNAVPLVTRDRCVCFAVVTAEVVADIRVHSLKTRPCGPVVALNDSSVKSARSTHCIGYLIDSKNNRLRSGCLRTWQIRRYESTCSMPSEKWGAAMNELRKCKRTAPAARLAGGEPEPSTYAPPNARASYRKWKIAL